MYNTYCRNSAGTIELFGTKEAATVIRRIHYTYTIYIYSFVSVTLFSSLVFLLLLHILSHFTFPCISPILRSVAHQTHSLYTIVWYNYYKHTHICRFACSLLSSSLFVLVTIEFTCPRRSFEWPCVRARTNVLLFRWHAISPCAHCHYGNMIGFAVSSVLLLDFEHDARETLCASMLATQQANKRLNVD